MVTTRCAASSDVDRAAPSTIAGRANRLRSRGQHLRVHHRPFGRRQERLVADDRGPRSARRRRDSRRRGLFGDPCTGLASTGDVRCSRVRLVADRGRRTLPGGHGLLVSMPMLGLAREAASWPVARLSSGERQRLALLRAIARKPRVLLLDEPTSGLDSDSARRVEAMLLDRIANGVGILMVTHDPEQARRMGTHHLRLAGGRVEVVA